MNLTINHLPSRTWNHLKMNGSHVALEGNPESFSPRAAYNREEISFEADSRNGSVLPGDLAPILKTAALSFGETKQGVSMDQPLVLSYDYEEGSEAGSRLLLKAGAGSHLKALMILTGRPELSAIETEILAGEQSVVDLYVVELLGEKSLCLNSIVGRAADSAKINLIKLELGGNRIYAGVNIGLKGTDSSFHSETGYHVVPSQTLDMNYVAVHEGKRTEALMEVNGTLEEGAGKIFRGTIDFRQGCAGAKATENENVMLMGDDLVNQTIPVILCKEEDVEGNHGASIGQLDEKVLFYLASRGISREAAQAMIAQARIDAICEKIPSQAVRDQVREFEKIRGTSHGEKL